MSLRIALVILFTLTTYSFAQERPFVPVILDQQNYNVILTALQEIKYKDAAPIIQFLIQLEQNAQNKIDRKPPIVDDTK